jgi:transketolase
MLKYLPKYIANLVKVDNSIVILTADNGLPDYNMLKNLYPEAIINFGISEANMITYAAGMAICNKKPYVFGLASFITMRAYEQIRNDICLQNHNVKIIGIGGGVCYSNMGSSHHAIEDIAIMRAIPNMRVVCPADSEELKHFLSPAIEGPLYIRIQVTEDDKKIIKKTKTEFGKGQLLIEGQEIALITTGTTLFDVYEAGEEINKKGIYPTILHLHTIKPIDVKLIDIIANKHKYLLIIEEHTTIGGLASAVFDVLFSLEKNNIVAKSLGIRDCFVNEYGSYTDIKNAIGISKSCIINKIQSLLA